MVLRVNGLSLREIAPKNHKVMLEKETDGHYPFTRHHRTCGNSGVVLIKAGAGAFAADLPRRTGADGGRCWGLRCPSNRGQAVSLDVLRT